MQRRLTSQLQHAQLRLDHLDTRLQQSMTRDLQQRSHRLGALQSKLRSPQQQLQHQHLRLSQLIQRMQQQWRPDWSRAQRASLDEWQRRLNICAEQRLQQSQRRLAQFAQSLQHISPLATLARGYAVAINQQGKALTSASQVEVNDTVNVRLYDGTVSAVVTQKKHVD